jgi:hypothetical protein
MAGRGGLSEGHGAFGTARDLYFLDKVAAAHTDQFQILLKASASADWHDNLADRCPKGIDRPVVACNAKKLWISFYSNIFLR